MSNKTRLNTILEAWNTGDQKLIREVYDNNVVCNFTGLPEPIRGVEALTQFIGTVRSAFPDFRLTFHNSLEEGDQFAVRWTWTGTQKGEWQGLAPTNRTVKSTGCTMSRSKNGKTVEESIFENQGEVWIQLGLIANPIHSKTRAAG